MVEKLELVYDFRLLLAKRDQLHIPLTPDESRRLDAGHRQLDLRVPTNDDRPDSLLPQPVAVQFTIVGGFGAGMLRHLTGGGMAVATPEPPPLGAQVIVLVKEPQHGVEYVFPCRVVARTLRGRIGMGLAFDGIPSQTRMGNKPSGVWRPELPGDHHPDNGHHPGESQPRNKRDHS